MVMGDIKNKKFWVLQLRNRVVTYWITKGWQKTTWVKYSASPAASTNQILIEDVLQEVMKVINSVISTSGKTRGKTTKKKHWEKHAYVRGVGWVTIEVDRRENSGISAILQNVTSPRGAFKYMLSDTWERWSTAILIVRRFALYFFTPL